VARRAARGPHDHRLPRPPGDTYAELAGLPAETGLWAALGALGCYALVGWSPQLSVGPESTTALMTATAVGTVAVARVDPAGYATVLG